MNTDQIQAWAQSVGVSPDDEGFGIIALAYSAGRAAALEEAAREMDYFGHRFYAERIRSLAAREKGEV